MKWPSAKAGRVLAALKRIGWSEKRASGAGAILQHATLPDYTWHFHGGEEIGPRMMARIASHTGLRPEDL